MKIGVWYAHLYLKVVDSVHLKFLPHFQVLKLRLFPAFVYIATACKTLYNRFVSIYVLALYITFIYGVTLLFGYLYTDLCNGHATITQSYKLLSEVHVTVVAWLTAKQ